MADMNNPFKGAPGAPGAPGDLSDLMKQAQKVQEEMQRIQQDLTDMEVTGEAGAGVVKVIMNGRHDVKKVIIVDEDLLDIDEKDILEDLLAAAFNSASQKVEKASKDKMMGFTKGLGLPPDFKLPTGEGGGEGSNN